LNAIQTNAGQKTAKALSISEIQASLPDDTAIVAWIDTDIAYESPDLPFKSWLCTLRSKGEPQLVALKGNANDGTWTDEDRAMSTKLSDALVDATTPKNTVQTLIDHVAKLRLARLDELLAETDLLPTARNIVVVSSGKMAKIPVQALIDLRTQGEHDYTVSSAPSASVFSVLNASDSSGSGAEIAGFADPTNDLPFSRHTAMWLGDAFGNSQLLVGSAVTPKSLDELLATGMRRASILHFASHVEPNELKPMQTAMILKHRSLEHSSGSGSPADSNDVTDDDILTAADIEQNWRLQANLVTVSGCASDVGVHSASGGNLAFGHAFLAAGAKCVLTTLWPVSDRATSLLEKRYYQNVIGQRDGLDRPMHPNVAIHEAQRWLRTRSARQISDLLPDESDLFRGSIGSIGKSVDEYPYEHPFYWAGFVLSGGFAHWPPEPTGQSTSRPVNN
jgi:CHAT domain-containing protein